MNDLTIYMITDTAMSKHYNFPILHPNSSQITLTRPLSLNGLRQSELLIKSNILGNMNLVFICSIDKACIDNLHTLLSGALSLRNVLNYNVKIIAVSEDTINNKVETIIDTIFLGNCMWHHHSDFRALFACRRMAIKYYQNFKTCQVITTGVVPLKFKDYYITSKEIYDNPQTIKVEVNFDDVHKNDSNFVLTANLDFDEYALPYI